MDLLQLLRGVAAAVATLSSVGGCLCSDPTTCSEGNDSNAPYVREGVVVIGGCLGRQGDPCSSAVYFLERERLGVRGSEKEPTLPMPLFSARWERLPDLPIPVRGAACSFHEAVGVVVSGGFDSRHPTRAVYRFQGGISARDGGETDAQAPEAQSRQSGRWIEVARLARPRSCHTQTIAFSNASAAAPEPFLCVFGGWDELESLDDGEVLSLTSHGASTAEASHQPSLLSSARKNSGIALLSTTETPTRQCHSMALICGGWDDERTLRTSDLVGIVPSSCKGNPALRLQPLGQGPLLERARECAATVLSPRGDVYCFGGYNEHDILLSSSEVLRQGSGSWEPGPRLPFSPRENVAVAVIGDLVVFAGGWDGHKALADVWALNLRTEEWTELPPLPAAVNKACATFVQFTSE